jgi:hypothetical protein
MQTPDGARRAFNINSDYLFLQTKDRTAIKEYSPTTSSTTRNSLTTIRFKPSFSQKSYTNLASEARLLALAPFRIKLFLNQLD